VSQERHFAKTLVVQTDEPNPIRVIFPPPQQCRPPYQKIPRARLPDEAWLVKEADGPAIQLIARHLRYTSLICPVAGLLSASPRREPLISLTARDSPPVRRFFQPRTSLPHGLFIRIPTARRGFNAANSSASNYVTLVVLSRPVLIERPGGPKSGLFPYTPSPIPPPCFFPLPLYTGRREPKVR
jgi:hypothetical protein